LRLRPTTGGYATSGVPSGLLTVAEPVSLAIDLTTLL